MQSVFFCVIACASLHFCAFLRRVSRGPPPAFQSHNGSQMGQRPSRFRETGTFIPPASWHTTPSLGLPRQPTAARRPVRAWHRSTPPQAGDWVGECPPPHPRGGERPPPLPNGSEPTQGLPGTSLQIGQGQIPSGRFAPQIFSLFLPPRTHPCPLGGGFFFGPACALGKN